jgi:exodeoxyribonuclease VII large subunit
LFDAVVIIRGGGSQTDLSWFDNYNLAYYITQFPLPVITGIGHEKDLSVTDMVACRALKTPTAVADFLIDCIAETENHLIEVSLEIQNFAREILDEFKERLERSKSTLAPLTRVMISQVRKTLSDIALEILKQGKEKNYKAGMAVASQQMKLVSACSAFCSDREYRIRALKTEFISKTGDKLHHMNNTLSAMENKLTILNPENVLKRGFTITSLNGKLLKTTESIINGDTIDTLFSDGKISSIVNGKNKRKS